MNLIEEEYTAFLVEEYGSIEDAKAAWNGYSESFDTQNRLALMDIYHLTADGKGEGGKQARAADQLRFLTEYQKGFYEEMVHFFREEIKTKSLLTASNWMTADPGVMEGLERYTYTAADVIDRHGYFGEGHIGDSSDWRVMFGHTYTDISALLHPEKAIVQNNVDGMEQDYGFPICDPPNKAYSPDIGRMGGALPGLHENGGIYCHATAFKAYMECFCGRPDAALRAISKIMPDSEQNPSSVSGADPYVFTNCYCINEDYYGKSYMSWTTGTSGWALRVLYEGLLGLRRDYGGLKLEPCLPAGWDHVEATREFRKCRYKVILNRKCTAGQGKWLISIDRKPIVGNILPVFCDNREHTVEAVYVCAEEVLPVRACLLSRRICAFARISPDFLCEGRRLSHDRLGRQAKKTVEGGRNDGCGEIVNRL